MKNIIKILVSMITVIGVCGSVAYAIGNCTGGIHNSGVGEIIKNGVCNPIRNSNGEIANYTQRRYIQGTHHANCNGRSNDRVHCSLIPSVVQRGVFRFSKDNSSCSGTGEPVNVQSYRLDRLSLSKCDYKGDKDEDKE